MMFGMGFGWIFGLLALLLIGWGALNVFNANRGQNVGYLGNGSYRSDSDALEILKQRYARGEISQNEFERMKKDLSVI